MQSLLDMARDAGFTGAALLDPATLLARPEVRAMCAADKCSSYNKNWMCPPACGSIEENAAQMQACKTGVLVQVTQSMEDDYDIDAITQAGQRHKDCFLSMYLKLKQAFPRVLALGAGACTLCEACTWPGAPCRQPGKAVSSMEAYGLWVSDVCEKNRLPYYHGPQTITYTGCFLLP